MSIPLRKRWLAFACLTASAMVGCKGMGTDMSSISRVPPPGTGSYSSPNSYYTPPNGSWSATPSGTGTGTAPASSGAAAGTGVSRSAVPGTGATSSAAGPSGSRSPASGSTIGTGTVSYSANGSTSSAQNSPVVSAAVNGSSSNQVQTAIFQGEDSVTSKVVPASEGLSDKPSASSASLPWRTP